MPRQPRLEYPSGFYHVINRGIERRSIYKQPKDYQYFIQTLGQLLLEEGHACHAWVLLSNHYHLLLERGTQPLSRLMNRLQTKYAGYFNRKYHRSGHFFQNRYKAVLCDKETYFLQLVAYIHLNPLKAGLVKSLEELKNYPWSGHGAVLGLDDPKWQEVDEVLARFGKKRSQARKGYLQYLATQAEVDHDLSGGGLIRSAGGLQVLKTRKKDEQEEFDTRILGGGEFVKIVAQKVKEKMASEKGLQPQDMEKLMAKVAGILGVPKAELVRRGKSSHRATQARALAAYLGVEYQQIRCSQWAECFRISSSAVSKLYRMGAQMVNEQPEWVHKILK